LKIRAAQTCRSKEAEIREIIEEAVRPTSRIKLGLLLEDIDQRAGLRAEDLVVDRDKTPAEAVRFKVAYSRARRL
jgi:plasmid stability protein